MRYCAAILASLLLVACSDPTPDYERMRESAVRVIVEVDGKAKSAGSGVLTRHGVLTAGHVAIAAERDDIQLIVQFKEGEFVPAKVVKSRMETTGKALYTDLALLSVPTTSGYPLSRVRCDTASVGEPVYVVGSPVVLRWAVTSGTVISDMPRQGFAANRWLQTDATSAPGTSGGPMYDKDGRVIGIVAHSLAIMNIPTGHYFGNSGPAVCDFLKTDSLQFVVGRVDK